jgi:hypothetical protein
MNNTGAHLSVLGNSYCWIKFSSLFVNLKFNCLPAGSLQYCAFLLSRMPTKTKYIGTNQITDVMLWSKRERGYLFQCLNVRVGVSQCIDEGSTNDQGTK